MRVVKTVRLKVLGHVAVLLSVLACLWNCGTIQTQAQWVNNGSNINNTNSGNVGIGTTTPTAKVHIAQTLFSGPTELVVGVDPGFQGWGLFVNSSKTGPSSGSAGFGGTFTANATGQSMFGVTVQPTFAAYSAGSDTAYGLHVAPTFSGTWTNKYGLYVTGEMKNYFSGNVGIGTTSPGEKFVAFGNLLAGNITNHTSLYSGFDGESNVIMELGYSTATAGTTPLPVLVLSKNLTGINSLAGTLWFANSSLANGSERRLTGLATYTDGATNSGALTFSTSSLGALSEKLRINSGGQVGIGTPTPGYRLDVQGGSINSSGGLCIAGDCKTAWSQLGGSQWTTSGTTINYGTGNVGIGVASPNTKLDVNGTVNATALTLSGTPVVSSQWATSGTAINYAVGNVGIGVASPNTKLDVNGTVNAMALTVSGAPVVSSQWATSGATINYANGNVGIATANPTEKLHVTGNVKVIGSIDVSGNINAKYQDVAEWVESSQELSAGTVVVLDDTKSNQVVASTQAYDSRVAGVISLKPGIALGERGDNHVLVATTGRVRVKVDARNGPIKIGDLLVTSDREGVAMKSLPIEVGGARIHRPGTLLGKALEPLNSGTGEILVLLSLQ